MAGLVDRGWSGRLGWYTGFHLMVTCDPAGVITGLGFGPASNEDHYVAETFFALRAVPHPRLGSVGQTTSDVYVADTGFAGRACGARWVEAHHAQVVCPKSDSARRWPPDERRRLAARRQEVETVCDRLLVSFRRGRDRPHMLAELRARRATKVGLHNVCIWGNRQHGQSDLALTGVLGG